MIEQVGNLMGGLTSGTGTGKTNNTANNPPNDTIYLCNFRHTFFPNFFLINHRKFYKVTCKWGKETIKKRFHIQKIDTPIIPFRKNHIVKLRYYM